MLAKKVVFSSIKSIVPLSANQLTHYKCDMAFLNKTQFCPNLQEQMQEELGWSFECENMYQTNKQVATISNMFDTNK